MFLHDFDFEDLDSIEEVITPNKGSVPCCQRFEFLRGLRSVLLGPFNIVFLNKKNEVIEK